MPATAPGWATSSSPTSSAAGCWCTCSISRRSTAPTRQHNYATVERELREHGHGLAELPRLLCLSKADLVPTEQAADVAAQWRARLGVPVLVTSAATGAGLPELTAAIFEHVPPVEEELHVDASETPATHRVYRPAGGESVRVQRTDSGAFRVEGERVERLIARHDVDNEEALRYVEGRLRTLGVIKALEAAGFEPGDDVEIAGIVFELDPGAPFR